MSTTVPAATAAPTAAPETAAAQSAAEAAAAAGTAQAAALGRALCHNCGTPLAGSYCSECGQRHHPELVPDFWHFIGEGIEDLTHADSRLWQTLIALLFRPGLLTREFLQGHRARYLPPVRLYLVVSVIFFIIAGVQSRLSNTPVVFVAESGKAFQYRVVPAPSPPRVGAIARTPGRIASGAASGLAALANTPAGRQQLCEESGTYIGQHGGWLADLGPRVRRNCLVAVADGGLERLDEAFAHNLERAMFLLLPVLALVMQPLYRKPPRQYVEHLLFFLHDHAFLFVAFAVASLLEMTTTSGLVLGPVDAAITLYIPVYFYRAMRRVYGQGAALTLSKLAVLGVAYFFLGILMFAGTFFFSFLTL